MVYYCHIIGYGECVIKMCLISKYTRYRATSAQQVVFLPTRLIKVHQLALLLIIAQYSIQTKSRSTQTALTPKWATHRVMLPPFQKKALCALSKICLLALCSYALYVPTPSICILLVDGHIYSFAFHFAEFLHFLLHLNRNAATVF